GHTGLPIITNIAAGGTRSCGAAGDKQFSGGAKDPFHPHGQMVMWEDARLSTHAMEIKTIKILLVEDNPDDVFFLRMVLHKVTGTHFELHPVKTLAAGLSRLAEGN